MARRAFTLVELLVVIAIVGMLSTVAVVATSSSRDKARIAAAQEFEARLHNGLGAEIVGEWLFDEASGGTAKDTSGNGRDAAITGPARVAGKNGGALNFPVGSYVTLGSDAAYNPANFTISLWLKSGDVSGSYNYIYSSARDCCGTYNGINLFISGNLLYGTIWNSGAYHVGPYSFPNNSDWTHVAFTYNGSKMVLYINGKPAATANHALGVGQPASFPAHIGSLSNCPAGCNHGGLTIDQVRLYAVSALAVDVRKMYLAEKDKYVALR